MKAIVHGSSPHALDWRPGAGAVNSAPVSLSAVADLLRGLDREQRRAVTHGDGPMVVVAGPGTGKTEVITRRVAWLIATKRGRPEEILALTFTDRAADEMQARVDVLVPYGQAQSVISTFHSFGDRIVREFGYELGLSPDPRVIGRAEQITLLREHLPSLGLARYAPLAEPARFLGALADRIARAKEAGIAGRQLREQAQHQIELLQAGDPADREASPTDRAAQLERAEGYLELALAQERYEELLTERGFVDFADQVGLACRLVGERAAVRAELRRRFRHFVVDEYQDTNPMQLQLLALLGGAHPNITVVGDDDQAIYTFRGAAPGAVGQFRTAFPAATQVRLRRNYRSLAPIVLAAQRLISHNGGHPSAVSGEAPPLPTAARRVARPVPVQHRSFDSVDAEADWVAAEIRKRVEAGRAPSDFAVLVRTNADARPVLRSLNMAGLPVKFAGASGLFARSEIRELLSFMRAVADPSSTIDLYGVATGAPYELGGEDMTAILGLARRRNRSLWWVITELEAQPGLLRLSATARAGLERLRADLGAALEIAHQRPAGEVLYAHLNGSGRLRELVADAARGEDLPLRNVARFFELISSHAALLHEDRLPFLSRHLDALVLSGDQPTDPEDGVANAIAVLTVHKAKGLEFSTVFLVGLVDGRFPLRGRADRLPLPTLVRDVSAAEQTLAEERRLCFVAITRARDELHVTFARRTAAGRTRRPSAFLAEALDVPFASLLETSPETVDSLVQRLANGSAGAAQPAGVDPTARRPATAPLTLSFSQIDDYLTCPLKYRLRHELRVPTPAHHALVLGNALHQAVAAFHLARRRGRVMSKDELLQVLSEHWSSEGFLSRDHEEARFAAARAALTRFHEAELSSKRPAPAGIERPFSVRVGRDTVRGRYDRVDETPEGTVITDYKSSDVREQKKADDRARDSLQLGMYALAHESESGRLPASVQLHFLETGVVGEAQPSHVRLERTRATIAQAADGIRARAFDPQPEFMACRYCPFRTICPDAAA